MSSLLADRQLRAIEAAAVPHMKDPADVVDKYRRDVGADDKPVRGKAAEAALARLGFNVRHVPKEPDGRRTSRRRKA